MSLGREQSEDTVVLNFTAQEFTLGAGSGGFLSDVKMEKASWWLRLCVLGILAAPRSATSPCMNGFTINVILLDDEEAPWSLKYVKGEILKAIETDQTQNPEGKTKERRSPSSELEHAVTELDGNCVVLHN